VLHRDRKLGAGVRRNGVASTVEVAGSDLGGFRVINFIIWLILGALIGWLASIVMRTDAQQGPLLNIIVGIVGAFLGGFLFNLLGLGGSNINNNDFSLGGLLVSFVGAIVLLGIINMFRRGSVR
jgi:uncharacterized membrane protein YeaQ/YmgE (transglycosylase-associated protein family)